MKVWITFLDEYHRWPLWIPVLIGIGVGVYFALPTEPSWYYILLPLVGLPGLFLKGLFRLPAVVVCLLCVGFAAGVLRTALIGTRMLSQEVGPLWVEGHVVSVEEKTSRNEKLYYRVLLDDIDGLWDERLPEKARVTLRGDLPKIQPGERIRVKAKLLPLQGPTHPGGFNFRRHNFFKGIEATGFNLSPPRLVRSPDERTVWSRLERERQEITQQLRTHMPSPEGGIAAALITGDRSGITDSTQELFAASGLAHLLAISGLHLSIVAGLVFFIVRRGSVLVPWVAFTLNTKKIAAVVAVLITGLYLALSGFGVPAQRAFMMTTLVMMAIFIDRNALSMRTVAFAASVIILLRPENLLGPSFQLSFAAVIGLITAYENGQDSIQKWLGKGGWFRRIFVYSGGVMFTSFIASIVTLPFTIMTFNQFTLVGVPANMLAVPLTAFIIMPLALVTLMLHYADLTYVILPLLSDSLSLLYGIAETAAQWPGAQMRVPTPSMISFLLVVFGGLWLCLWQQPWRWWGCALIGLGAMLAPLTPQPKVFVDREGKVVGLHGDDGQFYVTSNRRGRFQRDMWLRSLGLTKADLLPCEFGSCHMEIQGKRIQIIQELYDLDKTGDLVINLTGLSCEVDHKCISKQDLINNGAYEVYVQQDGDIKLEFNKNYIRF